MTDNKLRPHISAIINRFIPEHVREGNPKFVQFIQSYLEFLETAHGSGYFQNTLPEQRDIETQEEQFFSRIQKELGLFVPEEFAASPRVFYNQISELWRSKGSEDAVKTFFRLFLNDPVEIRFPWDSVLKPSDGIFITGQKIRVVMILGDPELFVGARIFQVEAFGFATVTSIEKKVYADNIIYDLSLVVGETIGEFVPGNRISIQNNGGVDVIQAEIYNSLSEVRVTNPGSGYEIGDRIFIEKQSRLSFTARVAEVDENGGILRASIIDFGSGTTPQFIRAVEGSGTFFFDEFRPFRYIGEDRELDLGLNFDVSTNLSAHTNTFASEIFFLEDYAGPYVVDETQVQTAASPLPSDFILSSPVDPTFANIVVKTKFGQGATFELDFGAIIFTEGFYEGVLGQLSESIVLQDSRFFQKYSYQIITSDNPINTWESPFVKVAHPAGMKYFALNVLKNPIDSELHIKSNVIEEDI
jgi:hypothetical protein